MSSVKHFSDWIVPLLGGAITAGVSYLAAMPMEDVREYSAFALVVVLSVIMLRWILGENSKKIDRIISKQEAAQANHSADQAQLLDAIKSMTTADAEREKKLSAALEDASDALREFKCAGINKKMK